MEYLSGGEWWLAGGFEGNCKDRRVEDLRVEDGDKWMSGRGDICSEC
mgnify:CR=1 FL=1